jgi:hypothetical protein
MYPLGLARELSPNRREGKKIALISVNFNEIGFLG